MVARQGQSEVSKQIEVQDKATVFRIVDPAVLPIKPTSPDRVKIILIGILAGIGGGLGLVLLKDQLDTSVKTVEMAKQFGLPILAVIPRIEEPQLLALQAKQDRRLYIAVRTLFLADSCRACLRGCRHERHFQSDQGFVRLERHLLF